MGAKRWPPVWLQRHTRAPDAGAATSAWSSVPQRPQHGSRRPWPHTSTSGGASPTTVGQSRRGRSRSASSASSRAGIASTATRWSTPSRWCVPVRRRCTTGAARPDGVGVGTTVITRAPGCAAAAASASISLTSDGHGNGHSTSSSSSNSPAEPIGSTPCACVHGEQRNAGSRRDGIGLGGVDGAHRLHRTDRAAGAPMGPPAAAEVASSRPGNRKPPSSGGSRSKSGTDPQP